MEEYGEKVREVLDRIIQENPQHSRVGQKVKQRLEQCGWKDEVRLECNKIIKKRGLENIHDMDELIQQVTPIARAMVPIELKKELVGMLKDALMQELEGKEGSNFNS